MSSLEQQAEFQSKFKAQFSDLVKRGMSRQEAAAAALLSAKEFCSTTKITVSQGSASTSFKSAIPIEPIQLLPVCELHVLRANIMQCQSSGDFRPAIRFVGEIFSSDTNLNRSFSEKCSKEDTLMSVEKASEVSIKLSNITMSSFGEGSCIDAKKIIIDIDGLTEAYKLMSEVNHEPLVRALTTALERLTGRMQYQAAQCNTPDSLKQFIIAFENPALLDPSNEVLTKNLLLGLDKLSTSSKKLICDWFTEDAGELRFRRYIDVIRQFMTLSIFQGNIDDARLATRGLVLLYSSLQAYPEVCGLLDG